MLKYLNKDIIQNRNNKVEDPEINNFTEEDDNHPICEQNEQYFEDIADISTDNEIHKLHMIQSLQALQYLKGVQIPQKSEIRDKMVFLPSMKHPKKKTLIFDMDETLIH